MSVGLRILLLGMFMLAQAGYALFLIKKGLSPVFAPVVLIIGQTLILYFSGFASCIRTAQVLLLALGILLLAISCRKDSVVRLMKSPGFWLFLLFAATDCMLVYRERLACWDDYSHWGRMAKALTFANGYPTPASDPDILYATYPPGMALWISYVSRFVRFGGREGIWIWAHNLLNFSCILAALSPFERLLSRTKTASGAFAKIVVAFVTVSLSMLVFNYTGQSFSLLVDGTIGLLCAAAIALCLYGFSQKPEGSKYSVLLACAIPVFKNSGLVFAMVFAVVFTACMYGGGATAKRKAISSIACFLLPLLLWGVWQLYARIGWSDVADTAQAVSLTRFMSIFSEKAANGRVWDILDLYVKAVFCGSLSFAVIFWAGMFAVLGLRVSLGGEPVDEEKRYASMLVIVLLGGFVYLIALGWTYLFSMNIGESLALNSIDRYMSSYTLLLLLLAINTALRMLIKASDTERATRAVCLLLVPALILTGFWNGWRAFDFQHGSFTQTEGYTDLALRELSTRIPEEVGFNTKVDGAILIVDDSHISELQSSGYWCYLLSYHIRIPNNRVVFVPANEGTVQKPDADVLASICNTINMIAIVLGDNRESIEFAEELGIPVYTYQGVAQ